jgi:nucleoside-diphosphate-sugar epimerase
MTRVLVTGADGFVGRALVCRLRDAGHSVLEVTRARSGQDVVAIGDIGAFDDWTRLTSGVSGIVHVAARAHVLKESAADPLAEFRRVNVAPTIRLARAAAVCGVRRFVFLSSIGVNGTSSTRPFTIDDVPNPSEPYALSKLEAEQGLLEVAAGTSLEVVRVRPPLIIGAGAKGNLLRLMRLVDSGLPLPLGGVRNHRSFIELNDLCDLLLLCLFEPRAAGELLLAADGESISTSELLRRIAAALGRRARILSVPPWLLSLAASSVGVRGTLERMTSSLLVDSGHARACLGWQPRRGLDAGIRDMARAYRQSRRYE